MNQTQTQKNENIVVEDVLKSALFSINQIESESVKLAVTKGLLESLIEDEQEGRLTS